MMRKVALKFVLLLSFFIGATNSMAATVDIHMEEDRNIRIIEFYADESGSVYQGSNREVEIPTRRGHKLIKLVVTARVVVYPHEYKQRQPYYDRFTLINETIDGSNRMYRVYEIKDVVRLSFELKSSALTVNKKLGFDYSTPALAFVSPNGRIEDYDRLVKLQDNMDFGIVQRPFSGPSNSGASVCLEQRQNSDYPMIVECVRWGRK